MLPGPEGSAGHPLNLSVAQCCTSQMGLQLVHHHAQLLAAASGLLVVRLLLLLCQVCADCKHPVLLGAAEVPPSELLD